MDRESAVVFLSGVRTGFGAFGGTLKDLSATDLGVAAAGAALARSGVARRGGGPCGLRQRTADLGRRPLPRPPRRPPRGPADRHPGRHRQPALRLGLRGRGAGRAADPAGRIAGGAGGRHRIDEPGAARGAGRALGTPPGRRSAAGGPALGRAPRHPVRPLHGGDGGEPGSGIPDRARPRWIASRR